MTVKNTKIICTIGPATESLSKLKHLINAGMNCARLNFSHGTYEHHALLIRNIRMAAKKAKEPIAIMQDLQGPRIRLGELPDEGIEIKRGEEVVLAYKKCHAGKTGAIILPTQEDLSRIVKKGEIILIKDGLVRLRAKSAALGLHIIAKVEQGGVLTSNRGINLPESKIRDVVITEKDKQDLCFGLKQKVDWIALSFVRNGKDIRQLRDLFPKSKSYLPKIIAKIERKEAVKNFDEILSEADGIMIARGDLGIEIAAQEIPLFQKEFIEKCLKAAKPVIVATQMLESMTINPMPTRAEVSDVANAVIDHTDAVMLSSETSTGKYPIASCQMMKDIIKETEDSPYDDSVKTRASSMSAIPSIIAHTAEDIVDHDHIRAIAVMSSSGKSAQLIASERPQVPIIAFTQNETVLRQMSLSWGVRPYFMGRKKNIDDLIKDAVKLVKKELKAKKGDKIIIASGHPTGTKGSLNLLKIHTI